MLLNREIRDQGSQRPSGRCMRRPFVAAVAAWASGLLLAIASAEPVTTPQSGHLGVGTTDGVGQRSNYSPAEVQAMTQYELRRARAHARIEPGPRSEMSEPGSYCPVLGSPTKRAEAPLKPTVPWYAPPEARWQGVAPPSDSAPSLFAEYISDEIVQSRCINCHVEGGLSGHTRLVLSPSSEADHESLNLERFRDFVETIEDGADRILNKIQGVAHGGGIQVSAGSAEFANMERFLRLLEGGTSTVGPSPTTLFDGVTMAEPEKTLRRAALIFAGRLPTQTELEAVSDGDISSLRRAIRNLMEGPGFHEFLIRVSNDRLLTDRHLDIDLFDLSTQRFFVDLAETQLALVTAAIDRGYRVLDPTYQLWRTALRYGLARAPLELIAYVVENDLPYTEILTADYIMANPTVARAYGAATQFDNPDDPEEFKPSRIVSYYRNDASKVSTFVNEGVLRGQRIVNPGNLSTDYPHAGVLNTTVFLRRYPTTATNRNRARSRWTYYHFLGVDIEKSASRTTDADALADTNNPTMNNPACTVCHRVMDPVAGAFQNYGEEGLYRDNPGGMDSLAGLYKFPEDGADALYQRGDTWYRDMREPGFDGELAPNPDNSLQWLAKRIAADPRFAEATVRFWWPGVFGDDVVSPPEDTRDSDFAGRLLASQVQAAEVEALARAFERGIAGGRPFNAKDLLAEIALSPWFRAETLAVADPIREVALQHAGVERLLTPEELARKTDATTGFVWGRLPARRAGGGTSYLTGTLARWSRYELLYGGIDSDEVTERTGDVTPLMAAVAQTHAVEVSCPIVKREFYIWPANRRRLFGGIDLQTTPATERGELAIRRKLAELHGTLLGVSAALDSPDVEESYRLFVDVWTRKRETEDDYFPGRVFCSSTDRLYLEGIADNVLSYDENGAVVVDWDLFREVASPEMRDPNHVARAWAVTLAFLLTDYRYLYF